ncbi:MAG: hypothetical protein R3318_01280 [Gammaproteobacteria bacterium]|nr:hypothetical protein [Gammaproteobacteria bacterium]
MKSKLAILISLCSLAMLPVAPAIAHGTGAKHAHAGQGHGHLYGYRNPSSSIVIRSGPVTYINSGSVYGYGYPAYGYPAYGYPPRYHQKHYNKHLPSTHVYGAYPHRKPYTGIRVNPHASSYQKKHAYGHGTYGYNHFSRRGNGSWYR